MLQTHTPGITCVRIHDDILDHIDYNTHWKLLKKGAKRWNCKEECSNQIQTPCFLLTSAEILNTGSVYIMLLKTKHTQGAQWGLHCTFWPCWYVFSPPELSRYERRRESICKCHIFKNSQLDPIDSAQKHQSIYHVTLPGWGQSSKSGLAIAVFIYLALAES